MSLLRPRQKRPVAPRDPQAASDPVSLPPPNADSTTPPPENVDVNPTAPMELGKRIKPSGRWNRKDDSTSRAKAMRIYGMRQLGMSYDEIAKAMGLSKQGAQNLVYIAGKNNWLDPKQFASATDRIENSIIPKALDRLESLMDARENGIRAEVVLETLKGTVFKQYDQAKQQTLMPQTVVAVQVVMPEGGAAPMRSGAVAGIPAYVEGEESSGE